MRSLAHRVGQATWRRWRQNGVTWAGVGPSHLGPSPTLTKSDTASQRSRGLRVLVLHLF